MNYNSNLLKQYHTSITYFNSVMHFCINCNHSYILKKFKESIAQRFESTFETFFFVIIRNVKLNKKNPILK